MNHRIILFGCVAVAFLCGCETIMAELPQMQRNVVQVQDFRAEMKWCEVRPDRSAECEVEITSQHQDKRAGLSYPKMQDDRGKEYRLKTDQPAGGVMMVAGQPYTYRLTVDNLPTYVTMVRSINSGIVASLPNGSKTLAEQIVFAGIPTRPATAEAAEIPAALPTPTTKVAMRNTGQAAADERATASASEWETVGYWNYDAVDGQQLSNGLVLQPGPGAGLGQQWKLQLELTTHADLRNRPRSLWPVQLNRKLRKVCAQYPDYPSYSAYIDLPGTESDGVYSVGPCSGSR